MRSILPIFGRSPFALVKVHMTTVHRTAAELRPFFEAFLAGDQDQARDLRKRILKLEHDADLIKNEIREHLPKSYFMPVDRRDLVELLHTQDSIADLAEDLVIVATLKESLTLPEDLHGRLLALLDQSLATSTAAHQLVAELDKLRESSFGGEEAERVLEKIGEVGRLEHEVDKASYVLAKEFYRREAELGMTSLQLWEKILQLIGGIANKAETIGDHLRLMMYR